MKNFIRSRPRIVVVLSLVIAVAGGMSVSVLPVADYPEKTPTMVCVSTTYAGASPQVVADTVAAPIEVEINTVDNVSYFDSKCNDSGSYTLNVTFKAGTDPDINLVNVQNAVKRAEPKLPGEVVQLGINVQKAQLDPMLRFAFTPRSAGDDLYLLGNFVCREVKEAMQRIDGVSRVVASSSGDYAMRIWLDSAKMDALGLSVFDVRNAISSQNIQPAAGYVGNAFASDFLNYKINVRGRLVTADEFAAIVVRSDSVTGARVLLGDVARCELGVQSYASEPCTDGKPAFNLSLYRDPLANSTEVAERCKRELDVWMKRLPVAADCAIVWDSTEFTREIVRGYVLALLMAVGLALAVLLVWFRSLRFVTLAAVVLPLSLVGAGAVLLAFGHSVNVFTLTALCLILGVVVGNLVAARGNVSTRSLLMTVPLFAVVFVPLAVSGGMVGMMHAQFASAACGAVAVSSVLSAVLVPVALGPGCGAAGPANRVTRCGSRILGFAVRHPLVVLLAGGFVTAGALSFARTLPRQFMPDEDRGLVKIEGELSEGSSLKRTSALAARVYALIRDVPGLQAFSSAAASSHLGRVGENRLEMLVTLDPWKRRLSSGLTLQHVVSEIAERLKPIHTARFTYLLLPAVNGLGSYGGVVVNVCALGNVTPAEQAADAAEYVAHLRENPRVKDAVSTFSADTPMLRLKVDRDKAQALGLQPSTLFSTLQSKLASFYVNDFNVRGGAYQVIVQNGQDAREDVSSALDIRFPGRDGAMVPLSAVGEFSYELGPRVLTRFNKLPSVQLVITPADGVTAADVVDLIERDPPDPKRYSLAWSDMTFQERKSRESMLAVVLAVILGSYLFLVVRYESWRLPIAFMLSALPVLAVPVAVLCLSGTPLSVYAQLALFLLFAETLWIESVVVDLSGFSCPRAVAEAVFRVAFPVTAVSASALTPFFLVGGVGAASRFAPGLVAVSGLLAQAAVTWPLLVGISAILLIRPRLNPLLRTEAAGTIGGRR